MLFHTMAHRRPIADSECPLEHTLAIVGGKWKPMILFHLLRSKTLRFGELRRRIPMATQQMLTAHLRELESDGIILRTVYPEVPPKVEYRLTDVGLELIPVFNAMVEWGTRHKHSSFDTSLNVNSPVQSEESPSK
jgi:DNA-binding HxlR family transcriptional regulator